MSRIAKLALLIVLVTAAGHPAVADTNSDLNNLIEQASKENGDGNFNDAETHYKQAVMLSVGKLGGMSNTTGKTCRQIADFYMNNNRFNDADHYLKRALVIAAGYNGAEMDSAGEFQNTRGFVSDAIQNPGRLAGNLDVASTLSSLGNLYSRMGRYGDAERLLKRVVQIYQGAADGGGNLLNYSANASETLAQNQLALAQVLYKGGNSNEAESMFKAYVETVRKDKGPSVDLANALKHVAVFYKSQNRSSEADAAEAESKELQNRFQ